MNKRIFVTILAVGGVLALAACSKHHAMPNRNMTPAQASALQAASAQKAARKSAIAPATPAAAATATLPHLAYIARLYPLNGSVTRTKTTGRAQFGINDGKLTIRIDVAGAPPGIAHAQHIHGFLNEKAASCPTSAADVNGNGIVSLNEAEATMGPPLIPLNANPLALNFTSLTYPTAAANGTYTYQETVSLDALQSAFAKAHNGQKLDLAKDAVMIHGVPESARSSTTATAPATAAGTVAAAPGSAAETTGSAQASIPMPAALPIACGKITAVKSSH